MTYSFIPSISTKEAQAICEGLTLHGITAYCTKKKPGSLRKYINGQTVYIPTIGGLAIEIRYGSRVVLCSNEEAAKKEAEEVRKEIIKYKQQIIKSKKKAHEHYGQN